MITYKYDVLYDADALVKKRGVERKSFYYVTNHTFFAEPSLEKAKKHGIKFITRAPETIRLTNEMIAQDRCNPEEFEGTHINQKEPR